MLAARLDMPRGKPRATALFAHCFTCSKDIAAARAIAATLADLGIAVLRFDFTGLASSQGEFANTNFSSNVEDLVAAAACLGREIAPPSILVGHSASAARRCWPRRREFPAARRSRPSRRRSNLRM